MSRINKFLRLLKGYNIDKLKGDIKFWLLVFGVIVVIILFATGIISIHIVAGNEDSNILYILLNALVFGVYINALGIFNKGTRKLSYKVIILFITFVIMITGFGYFDIQIHINLWFFLYKIFSSSSVHGINFFWLNIHFWSAIFFLSFFTESEESD